MTHQQSSSRGALESVSRALRVFVTSVFGRLLLLALTGWGAFALWNWVTTESVEEQQAGDTSSPVKIEGIPSFLVFTDDGKKHWEVAADSAQVVDNGDAWLAKGVSKAVLFRDEQPWITMRAPRVRYSNLSRNLDAVGGVTAQGPENFSFSTPQARWLEQKKLVEIPGAVRARLREMEFAAPNLVYQWEKGELESPGAVEVRVKGGVLRGKGMKTNINTRVVQLGRDVELVFVPGVATLPQSFASPVPTSGAKPANVTAAASTAPLLLANYNATKARPAPMSRSRLLPTALAFTFAAAPAALLVQAPTTSPAVAAPSVNTAGNVDIKGGTTLYNDNTGITTSSGGVTLREIGKEFVLSANEAIYDKNKNQASVQGGLKVETRDSTIRGAKLFGDFNRKLLTITGNVVISAYDKGDGMSGFRSSQARKPMRIACNRLDWNYATRQATLVGNLRIVQADNSGTCDTIVYDEQKNTVYLKGNVSFGNSKNQQFFGNEVVVYVDKGLVSAPNATFRSSVETPAKAPAQSTVKPAPRVVFPGQGGTSIDPGDVALPEAPPPIESLVPKSTPLVRAKPTLPPLPTPTPKPKAAPVAEDEDKSEES